MAATAGGLLLQKAGVREQLPDHFPSGSVALALFVLGPLAFAAQLLRMVLVTVTVVPQTGLVLRNGGQLSWDEIEGVEFAGLRFASDRTVFEFLLDILRALTSTVPGFGLMGLLRIGLMAVVLALILIVAVISGVLLPVFLLLSPWQPRVVVHFKDGKRREWRDLIHEADFVHSVESGLRRTAGRPLE